MLVQSYLTRARDFFRCLTLVHEDAEYKHSSALLAIHSGISYSDALRCGLGSTGLAADDHRHASAEMRKLLVLRGYAVPQGVKHLEVLLSRKTFVSYDDKPVTQEEVKSLVNHARRFAVWAEQVGLDLNIERWRNDIPE